MDEVRAAVLEVVLVSSGRILNPNVGWQLKDGETIFDVYHVQPGSRLTPCVTAHGLVGQEIFVAQVLNGLVQPIISTWVPGEKFYTDRLGSVHYELEPIVFLRGHTLHVTEVVLSIREDRFVDLPEEARAVIKRPIVRYVIVCQVAQTQ